MIAAAADASARRTGTGLADLTSQAQYFPEVPRLPAAGSPDRPAWDRGAQLNLEGAVAYALQGPNGDGRESEES